MVTRNGEAPTGAERRRHPRAEADWTVEIALAGGTHRARLRDVSRIGLCFHIERAIPMMTVLQIALDLPVDGGVRRVSGNGAVVRCQRISPTLEHWDQAESLYKEGQSLNASATAPQMGIRLVEGARLTLAGETVYDRQRLEPGTYSSSPLLADGKIYATNEDGSTTVFKAGDEFEILAVNKLADYTLASPVAVDNQIFIRTIRYISCIAEK